MRILTVMAVVSTALAASVAFAHDDDNDGQGRGTAVTACGTVIDRPGKYFLANDLIECPGNGIEIRSSRVELKLRGHAITSGNASGTGIDLAGGSTGLRGIEIEGPGVVFGFAVGVAFVNVQRSVMKGVTVTGNDFGVGVNRFFSPGPVFDTESTGNRFKDNVVTGNIFHGITSNGGNRNLYEGNHFSNNGSFGLYLFDAVGNRARKNVATQNQTGIVIQADTGIDNDIRGNIALGNRSPFDLRDDNLNCDGNDWSNNLGRSNKDCVE